MVCSHSGRLILKKNTNSAEYLSDQVRDSEGQFDANVAGLWDSRTIYGNISVPDSERMTCGLMIR